MPREVTVLHYKFEELDAAAKKRAVEKMQQMINEDFHYETQSITESFNERLKELGLPHGALDGESRGKTRYARDEEGTVEWSLSCCQGDGVAFYGPIDTKVAAKHVFTGAEYEQFMEVLDAIERRGCSVNFKIVRNAFGNRYSHSRTMYVDMSNDIGMTDETDIENELGNRSGNLFSLHNYLEKCKDDFCEFARETSSELESSGYDQIDYYTSEEAAKEMIEANDYEFNEHGNLV